MALGTVLEAQGKVKLNSNVAFRHFEKVNTPTPSTPALQLTMKQKIAIGQKQTLQVSRIRNVLSKHQRHAYLLLFLKEREKRPEKQKYFTGRNYTRQQDVASFNCAFML